MLRENVFTQPDPAEPAVPGGAWSRRSLLGLGAGLGWSAVAGPGLSHGMSASPGENRMALVIGNAGYAGRPLRNAVNDARAVARSLDLLGYRLLTCENVGLAGMLDAMKAFWLGSRDAQVRVVYFAGHGVVHQGRNYLLPLNAEIHSAADVSQQAAALDDLLARLAESDRGVNVVIVDACRTSITSGTRGIPKGLEPVEAPKGTLVAFSTAPGAVAYDGRTDQGPYARHLAAQLQVPGQPVEQMFKRVRQAVAGETGHRQVPWENSCLTGDFCFRRDRSGLCPAPSS